MGLRGLLLGLLLVVGCGRQGMVLDRNFEDRAQVVEIVRDQAPPRTTRVGLGKTTAESFRYDGDMKFELTHGGRRFASSCEAYETTLRCNIECSDGESFKLTVWRGDAAHGELQRGTDPAQPALFQLDGRRSGTTAELAGFSVRRGGMEVAAVELPDAIDGAQAWLTGALLEEERGALLAAFAALAAVR